jgi:hypothetical protein
LAESSSSPSMLRFKITRVGDILRNTASSQIDDYHQRFSKVSNFYDLLFKDLIINNYEAINACETARKLFGKNAANFVAIDGTEYSKPMFDMIIFYGGAYSCEGTFSFSNEGKIEIKYLDRFIDRGNDISSCLPLYVNEVPEIDQSFLDLSQSQVDRLKMFTDELILNNSNIANRLMGFAEFYLAYKYAVSNKFDIIFLDRSLSTTYLSLISTTSSRRLWQSYCSILGLEIDGLPIDINDLKMARQNIINEKLNLPPARGNYLRYRILFALCRMEEEQGDFTGLDIDSICKSLRIQTDDEKQHKRDL